MEIKTVAIIGLGAMGILYGSHLTKRMPQADLRIIADQQRIDRYIKDSIFCNGQQCEFHYVTPEEKTSPADLVLFTVKHSGLEDAIRAVKNQVGKNTLIVSALNGITSEARIGQAYGHDKVLYSVAQGMDAVKEGNRLTYAHMGFLCFGDRELGSSSSKVKRVADFFAKMEFPYLVDTDMPKRLWGKLMLNVGVNQAVAVYGSNYGVIQREGQARDTMIAAMREVMVLAEKEDIDLSEADLDYWLGVLSQLSPEGKPSMRQDVEAGRYSEVELFAGTVIELGKKYGITTPVNQSLYD
ncbi:MAG TPA: 2-dehydropantoate 2-reductase [Desulfitobacterium dehalogenans]|uniref:2-dehydropantoate 2-reductase n=1 Tax=Desulfitobacterium dehalogenans TaxID=36854 RepID=A0A7C7D3D4_9FIRM|nr:2-dehydropantoate 2-reductase [Desulfitobacterium dehalogenans]